MGNPFSGPKATVVLPSHTKAKTQSGHRSLAVLAPFPRHRPSNGSTSPVSISPDGLPTTNASVPSTVNAHRTCGSRHRRHTPTDAAIVGPGMLSVLGLGPVLSRHGASVATPSTPTNEWRNGPVRCSATACAKAQSIDGKAGLCHHLLGLSGGRCALPV